ncbi:MAG: S-methyl-5'-thioadenosine phosphorylase [Elusimicrobiota bacterium]
MKEDISTGVIGGSGLYKIEGIENIDEIQVETPFGNPSDKIITGDMQGKKICFLPRHGRGHFIPPSEVNYRANIFALKKIGVERIISVSACGSLKETIKPKHLVIPDQIYDRTKMRVSTFFEKGLVAHIQFDKPYCHDLSGVIYKNAKKQNAAGDIHLGGTYVCIEGPQFSTVSESRIYRKYGFDIIGMTNLPEAKLAREAEMCYATIGMVTDYDVWKEGEEVSVDVVVANLMHNVERVKKIIKETVRNMPTRTECTCRQALKNSIQTKKDKRDKKIIKKLSPIVKKYID